jgi:hypothetical protein
MSSPRPFLVGTALVGACLGAAAVGSPAYVVAARGVVPHGVAAAPGRVLTGLVRADDFVVPVGTSAVVVGRLHVEARGDILVAGTILLGPGAAIDLDAAGRLTVARGARIVPAASVAVTPASARELLAATQEPPLSVLGDTDYYVGGTSAEIAGTIIAQPGQSVKVWTHDRGKVTVTGRILLMKGRSSRSPMFDGQKGGSVSLGLGLDRVDVGSAAFIQAGAGGAGFTDTDGRLSGSANPCHNAGGWSQEHQTLELQGTNGGDGGSVTIIGDAVSVETLLVSAGAGGSGGGAGRENYGGVTEAPNGQAGHAGAWVEGVSGSGGVGGAMGVFASTYQGRNIYAAKGGDAGKVAVAAGAGAAGCDGGQTLVKLGRPGANGSFRDIPAGSAHADPRVPEPGSVNLFAGGNGGPAPDRSKPGGNGGSVQIMIPLLATKAQTPSAVSGNAPTPPAYTYLAKAIDISSYGNGGKGWNGCSPPGSDGTDGGAGGKLSFSNPVAGTVSFSFRGGDGGDGDPFPGDGGRAGTRNRSAGAGHGLTLSSFVAGRYGQPCPPLVAVATEVGSPQPPSCAVPLTWTVGFRADAARYDGEQVVLRVSGPGAPGTVSEPVRDGVATFALSEPASDWGASPSGANCQGGDTASWWKATLLKVGRTTFKTTGGSPGASSTSSPGSSVSTKVGPPTISSGG